MTSYPKHHAAQHYHHINVMTAGSLKSIEMLLDKGVQFLVLYQETLDVHFLTQVQNVLSQIQSALNLEEETARQLHYVISVQWDAIESRRDEAILKVEEQLRYLQETFALLQRK